MIRGKPLFDGVAVMEFTCNFTGDIVQLEAKAAFVQTIEVGDRKGGATHGYTTCTHWSDDTMKRLADLREAMEKDLAVRHFQAGALQAAGIKPEEVGGIGENLTDEDGTPQL